MLSFPQARIVAKAATEETTMDAPSPIQATSATNASLDAGSNPAERAKFVRNTWYDAMFSSDLAAGQLMHRTILNEPVLFYRKEDGGVAAITDRCSHRFVPLSMGKLLPGNRVQCIYHGLEFGADGHCVKNPHGNAVIPKASHLK